MMSTWTSVCFRGGESGGLNEAGSMRSRSTLAKVAAPCTPRAALRHRLPPTWPTTVSQSTDDGLA